MTISPIATGISGLWIGDQPVPMTDAEAVNRCLHQVTQPLFVVDDNGARAISHQGRAILGDPGPDAPQGLALLGYAPAISPAGLGDPVFKSAHGLTYPYVAGAMANGITSVAMVEAVGKAGMIGFFGAAGLSPQRVEEAIVDLQQRLGQAPYGFNLIHSPHDPDLEWAVVDLYLKHGVRRVSASGVSAPDAPIGLLPAKRDLPRCRRGGGLPQPGGGQGVAHRGGPAVLFAGPGQDPQTAFGPGQDYRIRSPRWPPKSPWPTILPPKPIPAAIPTTARP